MASRLLEWTIIACFPAGIFLLLGVLEIPSFVDPCHSWQAGSGEAAATCIGRTSTSETKMEAVTRLLLFQGTTLLGLVVGLVGAARGLRLLVGVGAGVLAAISIPLMTQLSFVFPLASAAMMGVGLWLFGARSTPSSDAPYAGRRL